MNPLTERQRESLWLRAQGLTAEAIGRRLVPQIKGTGAQDLLISAYRNLDAKDSMHAVFLALTLGIIGPYLDCGTRKAYLRHLRRNEQSCIACRKANTAFVREQRDADVPRLEEARSRRGVSPVKELTERQLAALRAVQAGAKTGVEIAAVLGNGENTARKLINTVMDKFGIDHITYKGPVSYKQVVERGIELGYLTEEQSEDPPVLSPVLTRVLIAAEGDVPITVISRRTGLGKRSINTRMSEIYRILGIESEDTDRNSSERRALALSRARDLGYLPS